MGLEYSTVSRITGEDELLAVDVKESCNANRIMADIIERVSETCIHKIITVGTTPILLQNSATPLSCRRCIILQNQGNSELYIGNNSVSINNGLIVYRGATMTLDFAETIEIYGVSDKNINILVMEIA